MITKRLNRQIPSLPSLPLVSHSIQLEKQNKSPIIQKQYQNKRRLDTLFSSARHSSIGEFNQRPRQSSIQKEINNNPYQDSPEISLQHSLNIQQHDNSLNNLQQNNQNNQKSLPPLINYFNIRLDEINLAQDDLTKHPFRQLIFCPIINELTFRKHLLLVQKGLQYSKRHLRGPSVNLLKSMQLIVERDHRSKTKSLFLDLDETLIHSCSTQDQPDYEVIAFDDTGVESKVFTNFMYSEIPIKVRPYCREFIKATSQYFDIYIFTASSLEYSSGIIKYLDPDQLYIKGIYCRDHCMETKNGLFIKDLRIFQNLDLKNLILVDNLSHSFGFQLFNGVPILEWRQDKSDQELIHLANYLKDASRVSDVREYNKKLLKLNELINFNIEQ